MTRLEWAKKRLAMINKLLYEKKRKNLNLVVVDHLLREKSVLEKIVEELER